MSLQRYIEAQTGAVRVTYSQALQEIKHGRRKTRWLPYIMPKLATLDESEDSRLYGIETREEAVSYLHHPMLGLNMRRIAHELTMINGMTIMDIIGSPYDEELQASLTLFHHVSPKGSEAHSLFSRVIDKYYDGKLHRPTLDKLGPKWRYQKAS